MRNRALPRLPALHAAMLDRVIAVTSVDPCFEALLGTGSLVSGGFDAESDLDLVLVAETDRYGEAMAERRVFAGRLGDLLASCTGEHVGEPRLLICLYGPPLLHVDLKFVASDDLGHFSERPRVLWARDASAVELRLDAMTFEPEAHDAQWYEDRAWLWLHYSAAKLRRGEYFEALSGLDFFRDVVLGPMLRRNAGERPRGLRRIEGSPGAQARLVPTLAAYDRAAILEALHRTIALYMELRAADPPPAPTPHMPEALLDYVEARSVETRR
ncbi:MAG: hypothetical protein BGN99_05510 [Alphaproteobacteria bacterium 65-37]|nr:nucleotidyltransferase domain-containing protein [Alphaproteobacteria bacterium]OJU38513.1 MAG: hypothetical protein BGN99_05510 [Alphaproteobacteria bacterium 65-37]